MWDRRMLGVPNRAGKKTIEVDLDPEGWPAASVAPRRQADVGYPCLTYVTVLSAVEAAQINVGFKKQAEETFRANLKEAQETHRADWAEGGKGYKGYIGQNIDEQAVQIAAKVDELLEAIKQEGYFSSWVIIEECTTD